MKTTTLPLVAIVLSTLLGSARAGDRVYRPLPPSTGTVPVQAQALAVSPADDPENQDALYEAMEEMRRQAIEEQKKKTEGQIRRLAARLRVSPAAGAVRSRIAMLDRYAVRLRWIPGASWRLAQVRRDRTRLVQLLGLIRKRAAL